MGRFAAKSLGEQFGGHVGKNPVVSGGVLRQYQYGKKEGEVTFVDRKGKIILIGNYENDDPVGNWYTPTWWDNGFPITSSYARNQFPGAIDEMVQIIQFYKNSHYRFIGNLDIQNCE